MQIRYRNTLSELQAAQKLYLPAYSTLSYIFDWLLILLLPTLFLLGVGSYTGLITLWTLFISYSVYSYRSSIKMVAGFLQDYWTTITIQPESFQNWRANVGGGGE